MNFTKKTNKLSNDELMKRRKRNSWIIFGAFLLMRFFVVEHFMVPSSSMTPTLITGDIILIKKYNYAWSRLSIPFGGYLPFAKQGLRLGKPRHGDVAVFIMLREPAKYYVKRIVAVAGDYVQMKEGVLYINKEPVKMELVGDFKFKNDEGQDETGQEYRITLPESTACKNVNGGKAKQYTVYRNKPFGLGHIDNTLEFKVPDGHVWVQGDYHTGSADSFSTHFMGPISLNELVGKPFFVLYSTNSRTAIEPNWIKWLLQLPWRILVSIKDTNFKRICIKVG